MYKLAPYLWSTSIFAINIGCLFKLRYHMIQSKNTMKRMEDKQR